MKFASEQVGLVIGDDIMVTGYSIVIMAGYVQNSIPKDQDTSYKLHIIKVPKLNKLVTSFGCGHSLYLVMRGGQLSFICGCTDAGQ